MQVSYALCDGLHLYPMICVRALNPKLVLEETPGNRNWRRSTRPGTASLLLQSTSTVNPWHLFDQLDLRVATSCTCRAFIINVCEMLKPEKCLEIWPGIHGALQWAKLRSGWWIRGEKVDNVYSQFHPGEWSTSKQETLADASKSLTINKVERT